MVVHLLTLSTISLATEALTESEEDDEDEEDYEDEDEESEAPKPPVIAPGAHDHLLLSSLKDPPDEPTVLCAGRTDDIRSLLSSIHYHRLFVGAAAPVLCITFTDPGSSAQLLLSWLDEAPTEHGFLVSRPLFLFSHSDA